MAILFHLWKIYIWIAEKKHPKLSFFTFFILLMLFVYFSDFLRSRHKFWLGQIIKFKNDEHKKNKLSLQDGLTLNNVRSQQFFETKIFKNYFFCKSILGIPKIWQKNMNYRLFSIFLRFWQISDFYATTVKKYKIQKKNKLMIACIYWIHGNFTDKIPGIFQNRKFPNPGFFISCPGNSSNWKKIGLEIHIWMSK